MTIKTTIELPEALLVAAKRHAAARRTTLRMLVERGLRSELGGRGRSRPPARIKWVTVQGGLPGGVDVSDRRAMMEAIRRR
jgi:hypothetical protein